MNVVRLSPASPNADLRALQEVSEFASTDMGWGGDDRWTYRVLPEEQITPELLRLSRHTMHGPVDCVTFQPCTSYEARSQDRYVVQRWDLPGGPWTFTGVFDGHGAHGTVDFVTEHLPAKVRNSLQAAIANGAASPAGVSRLLGEAIVEIDRTITANFLRLFPTAREELAMLGDEEVASIMNHPGAGPNSQNILRCMQGSTALVTLVDPSSSQLWVANLGDCRAVLVSKNASGALLPRRLNDVHNGSNSQERRRIRNEHPGERECMLNDRILGFLAPTRALGDTWMKLPAVYSRRVLMKTKEFWSAGISGTHIDRLKTPPYVSNAPDVYHHYLRKPHRTSGSGRSSNSDDAVDLALILCSDGLVDLYEDQGIQEQQYLRRWAAKVGEGISPSLMPTSLVPPRSRTPFPSGHAGATSRPRHGGGGANTRVNLAVHLLRDAIGGDDIARASANLTVEMDDRWMDDTTILVHRFL